MMQSIKLCEKTVRRLAEAALQARENAYCPYSGFAVGAALLTADGKIYTGVNIENAAFGPTNCAERTAFFTAVAAGEREFAAIAVAGGKAGEAPQDFCAPCGVCRQVMREFCRDDFSIILAKPGAEKVCTLRALLPESFSPENLRERE
ncbi:MAG: cytidine deaminase [Hominenteromicrobium sp.]